MNTVIVVGTDHYNTLGMIRSLGEKKVPIVLIYVGKNNSFVKYSKYIKRVIWLKAMDDLEKTIEGLKNEFLNEKAILFPCTDLSAILLDKNNKNFQESFIVPNAGGKIGHYMNKNVMSKLACMTDLLVPHQYVYELKELLETESIMYPIIVKPLASVEGNKSDISICRNKEDLTVLCNNLREKGYCSFLIEEYIHGKEEYMIEFIGARASDGSIYIPGWIKKIRDYPVENGSTAYAEMKNAELLNEYAGIKEILKKINYVGLFDAEFKHTEKGNYFIELNLRNGAPGYAYSKIGCNIPYWWYCKETGIMNDAIMVDKEMLIMCEHIDFINVLKGEIGLFMWLKQYIRADIKVFHSMKDLLPQIFYMLSFVALAIRKVLKR